MDAAFSKQRYCLDQAWRVFHRSHSAWLESGDSAVKNEFVKFWEHGSRESYSSWPHQARCRDARHRQLLHYATPQEILQQLCWSTYEEHSCEAWEGLPGWRWATSFPQLYTTKALTVGWKSSPFWGLFSSQEMCEIVILPCMPVVFVDVNLMQGPLMPLRMERAMKKMRVWVRQQDFYGVLLTCEMELLSLWHYVSGCESPASLGA